MTKNNVTKNVAVSYTHIVKDIISPRLNFGQQENAIRQGTCNE